MIPAEAVEAAAKAMRDKYAAEVCELPVASFMGDALTAIEAAAPYIRLAALSEAAEVVASEERDQWRRAADNLPGAQLIAQKLRVIGAVIVNRAFSEGETK